MRRWLPAPALALVLGLSACTPMVRPDLPATGPDPEPEEPVVAVAVPPATPGDAPPATADAPPPPEPVPVEAPLASPGLRRGAEVFERLRAGFNPPICVRGERNRGWRRRYAGSPQVFARHLGEILPLLDYVSLRVQEAGLPMEYALIPLVESWYRPNAIGAGGPAGMWQMIASTARNHGLRVDREYDGRLSPADSTAAALSYLRTLHGMFGGEWRASAMGYNAGEYRILRAFRAAGNDRVSGEHRLPRGLSPITYDYVAKLHALACLISKPERAGLVLPDELEFRPLRVEAVPAGARSLDALAEGWQVRHDRLRQLNPAFRQGRIPRSFNGNLLVPGEALAGPGAAVAAAAGDPGQAADPQPGPEDPEAPETHTVGSGDTLWGLSRRYGVSLGDLLRWNRLGRSSVLRIGQVLRLRP